MIKEDLQKITAKSFGLTIAKTMGDVGSSYVLFLMQQAYGEIDWDEVDQILDKVLAENKERP